MQPVRGEGGGAKSASRFGPELTRGRSQESVFSAGGGGIRPTGTTADYLSLDA